MIDFIKNLSDQGIYLHLKEGKLKLSFEGNISPDILQEVKAKKEDIIAYLENHSLGAVTEDTIQLAPKANGYPLSVSQKRFWAIDQINSNANSYNIPSEFPLEGDYDIALFEKAIMAVIDRHEILRTVFKQDENQDLKQWILDTETLNFKMIFKNFEESENGKQKAYSYIDKDAYKPFNLETGPLLRAAIFKIDTNKFIFYFNMHHIISDGWSMNLLSKEVMEFYEAFKNGQQPQLPVLKIQHKDFAYWQHNQSETAAETQSSNYWTEKLAGDIPRIQFPTAKIRPTETTNAGERLSTYIKAEDILKLEALSKKNGGTLFIGLAAVWNVLLYRYTNQKDITIATPVSGRERSELKNQIGCYINTLVLRNQLNAEDNFEETFKKIRESVLTDFKYQTYPFDKITADLNLPFNPNRNPLFDIMITYNGEESDAKGIVIEQEDIDKIYKLKTVAKFDLDIAYKKLGNYLLFDIVYNTDVYEQETIETLVKHFKQILNSIVNNVARPIAEIDFLNREEKRVLLGDFLETSTKFSNKTIFDHFAAQVTKTPTNNAIVCEDKEITYQELDKYSNQFAQYLQEKYNVKKGDFVGVELSKNEWTLVCVLGILKSGGAYVPIDTSYPEDRKKFIQEDSNCTVNITNEILTDFINQKEKFETVFKQETIQPTDLAYMIYTSGSTGKPKGVMISHGSLENYLTWGSAYYLTEQLNNYNSGLFTTLSFDLTVTSTFLSLIVGGTITIFPEKGAISETLKTYIESGLSWIKLTPAHIHVLEKISIEKCNLQLAIVGGEALQSQHVKILKKLNPNIRIVNEYGPTEATVGCVVDEVTNEEFITIGNPIQNTQTYIINEKNKLQPVGIVGELCISGKGLANGYKNRDELTAEKFMPHPFEVDGFLYKTGDLAYFLPDGRIVYKGRKDDQVKLRGYRIELGAIEAQISNKEEVQEAVAMITTTQSGEKQLIAFVVSTLEETENSLRKNLSEKLPSYMIPERFIQLETIPLTVNGKVNRKQLLEHIDETIASGTTYVAPTNEIEEKLILIWEQILQRTEIGINDHFFELGGHSMKALTLVSLIQKQFNKKVGLKQLFLNPRIQEQAILISQEKYQEYKEIPKVALAKSYPISFEQKRIWLLSQDDNVSISYNMPTSLEFEGKMNLETFEKAVWAALEKHEALRTVFKEEEQGDVKQWIIPIKDFQFTIDHKKIDQEGANNSKVEAYLKEKFYTAFDLENGPLVRVGFLQLTDNKFVLYYCMHHLINDGASMEILGDEISRYYQLIEDGNQIKEAPLRIQYKDYVAWQLQMFETDVVNDISEYWKETFQNNVTKVKFPFEKKRPENFQSNGNIIQFDLKKEIKDGFQNITTASDGSMYISFVFLVNTVIHQYLGDQNIMVGSSFSTRTHEELSEQIGFYVNNLPVVAKADASLSLKEFYSQLRNTVLTINSNSWYPLEKVIEDANYIYDASYSGLFNVLVEYHSKNATTNNSETEAFYNETEYTYNVPCQFDLSLEFFENDQKITCVLTYNNALYDESQIELLKDRLVKIAETLTESIDEFDSLTLGTVSYEDSYEPEMDFSDALFAELEENF
ncbi:MAG: amino acid adenylation domain-containing protein [Kordia sp.]|uniref:amino acid adenylation domain-containing protein n=1 Tax=Kordia sp. TaxID=1965332 RepID=UPI00385EA9E9